MFAFCLVFLERRRYAAWSAPSEEEMRGQPKARGNLLSHEQDAAS
jgi:hypothetical protein